MFKKFNTKDDVSGSTSLKSSVQRGIRTALLAQMPFLARPAYRDAKASTLPAPGSAEETVVEAVEQVEDEGKKKGGKKGGGGKGGGKSKGKGKDKDKDKGDSVASAGVNDAAGGEPDDEEAGGEMSVLDEIWPKKEALGLTKCHDRISLYTLAGTPLFFNHFDGPYIPTLKLLHQYPGMLPHVRIDRGAIKFLLAGANMMAPGLLSAGGDLPDGLIKDAIVAIHAEGKEHACGIGKMAESSADVKKSGKGVAVEVLCWIGDDLWKVDTIGL